MKEVIVIGGPNGAGKTTAATDLLPVTLGIDEFINADEIARGLSPFNAASRDRGRPPDAWPNAWRDGCRQKLRVRNHMRKPDTHSISPKMQTGRVPALVFLWLPSPEACRSASRNVFEKVDTTFRIT
jgi:hypothetical protein